MDATPNLHLKQPRRDVAIVAALVASDTERMRCLPEVVGRHYIALEHTVYDMLSRLSEDYDGGLWDYFRLSNGGFYMAPAAVKPHRLVCDGNGFSGEVSADTAGIIATAMAYSHLFFIPDGSCFARAYELLSLFIFQHPEVRTIRAALD